ncbi:hypothetical protein [Paenibacillus sp. 481]|uniref:hypothetical protein n=1 Tax=Paenibacillus sp. 481 TaxID=2835869 RepID=UPI001E3F15E0|nr:hypothetical protein [Paenibacillus sp. 481]UHA75524.1 hypothetical protein KIK04_11325 [Paenibacillus sp. 481]
MNLNTLQLSPFPPLPPSKKADTPFAWYADRIVNNELLSVVNWKQVNRIDLLKQKVTKLIDSKRMIYNIAISPNGSYFALLIDSDGHEGTSADLLIYDRTGKKLKSYPQAAYFAHSDGFVRPYPIYFQRDDTIHFETEAEVGNERIRGDIALKWRSGKETFTPLSLVVSYDDKLTISKKVRSAYSATHKAMPPLSGTNIYHHWFSPSRQAFVAHDGSQVWVYSMKQKQWQSLGCGYFQHWIDKDRFVWLSNYIRAYY